MSRDRRSAEEKLHRRCRRLVRAYPRGPRADEVLATLMDTNEGRCSPRAGDVPDVLWHGMVERLRATTVPGTRFGGWGDAASVAVVAALVMQAAVAGGLASRWFLPTVHRVQYPNGQVHEWPLQMFGDRREAYVAIAAALVAVATAAAACLGRVKAARWLSVGLVVTVGAGAAAARAAAVWSEPFLHTEGRLLGAAGLALVAALVLTSAVARATAVVPRRWWAAAAVVCAAAAYACTDLSVFPILRGRSGPALLTFGVQGVLLVALALPLVRVRPAVLGGIALLAVPALPVAAYAVTTDHWPMPQVILDRPSMAVRLAVIAACAVPALLSVATLRRARD